MRVVIIGAGGFVGSAIRRRLPDAVAPEHPDLDLTDGNALRNLLRSGDVVINAAGYANATDRSEEGVRRFRRDNVDGVRVLASACEDARVAQLIHVSSVAAMGRHEGTMLSESDSGNPRSPYAESKRDAEHLLLKSPIMTRTTILRPTSVFGPGRGLAATLCRVSSLPLIPLPGGGRALIPMTDIDTVASAVEASIGTEACLGRTFIIGDDRSYSLKSIITGLSGAMGRSPRVVSLPAGVLGALGGVEGLAARLVGRPPLLDRDRLSTLTKSVTYSTAAFRDATGFRVTVTVEETLRSVADWYTAR